MRYDDRNYQVGDTLILKEYCPMIEKFTGDCEIRKVTFLLSGGQFGIDKGTVVMGLRKLTLWDWIDTQWWKFKELMERRWQVQ